MDQETQAKIEAIPPEFRDRVEYGNYDGRSQYFINRVDGTLARLGRTLPSPTALRKCIEQADIAHARLIKRVFGT